MFKTRLISGIFLIIAALVCIIIGGPLLWGVLLVISLIGMRELFKAVDLNKGKAFSAMEIAAYAGAIAYYIVLLCGAEAFALPVVVCGLIAVMAVYVFAWPTFNSEQAMAAFFGIVYVAVMLSCVYQTRLMSDGAYTVWLIFICSWGCDTCAYCVGMLIGKHKMSPKLSPKKSIEGAVGGVVGAALLGVIYAACIGRFTNAGTMPILEYALIGAAGALISMVGDLAASAIKRNHNIKDYGRLIPGHGGILDRFDSVIFTAPVILLLAKVLIK